MSSKKDLGQGVRNELSFLGFFHTVASVEFTTARIIIFFHVKFIAPLHD